MFATLYESTNDFSSQPVTVDSLESDHESVAEVADTWDDYTSSMKEAIVDALTARTLALREYAKLQAVADSARLQVDLSSSHLVREAVLHQTACTNRAHTLKVLIEQYNVQVSTLKSQLAFWQNQLPA